MRTLLKKVCVLSLLSLMGLFLGCGTGLNKNRAAHILNFIAVKGAISGATITLYSLDSSGNHLAKLGTGTTELGFLTSTVIPADTPIEAELTDGTYTDEATGVKTNLGSLVLHTRLSNIPKTGSTIYITALTELAFQYAKSLSGTLASNIDAANDAIAAISGLKSIVLAPDKKADPTKIPADPTSETAKYGLVLAGLCEEAKTLGVSSTALVKALSEDISDGYFNGKTGSSFVSVDGGTTLEPTAFTTGLSTGMTSYLANANNPGFTSDSKPSTTVTDYTRTLTSISFEVKSGSDSQIYDDGTGTTTFVATPLDQQSRPMPGITITVAIPTNGGTIATNPVTSDKYGLAEFALTSSSTRGTYSYTASSGGKTSNSVSLIFSPCAGTVLTHSPFGKGKGSVASPYMICTRTQFNNIGTDAAYTTRHFILGQSIDLSAGVTSVGDAAHPFSGSFNGDIYQLTGVSITGSANNVGLFSYVNGGTIKSLTVTSTGVSAAAYNNVGVLIGYATGPVFIKDVIVTLTGSVTGAQFVGGFAGNLNTSANTIITGSRATGGSVAGSLAYVGGFAGQIAAGSVRKSYSTVPVTSTFNNASAFVGGFTGKNAGTISSSYSTGTVTNATALGGNIGGLSGLNTGTVNYFSYATGTVTASATSTDVGGLVGYNSGTIAQTLSNGSVTGGSNVGGLVGNLAGGTLRTSYSTSTVTGSVNYVGGLIGLSSSTVNDCYASGNVSASGGNGVGGAIGTIASGTVSRIFSLGTASGSTNVGGLTGGNAGTLASGFWDTTTSGLGSSAAGSGLATAAMKNVVNLVSQCWDFGTVWQISSVTGYPILQWQRAQTPPAVSTLFAGGSGTLSAPYLISSAAQLGNVAYAIQLSPNAQSAYYQMTTNINLSGATAPSPVIGCSTYPFKGTFDGQSNQIQNYSVTGALDNVGLFGYISDAKIKALTLNASTVSAASYNNVGAVVGYATGVVSLSDITLNLSGAVTGTSKVGGFGGYINASALSSFTSLTVANAASGNVSVSGDDAGGLFGYLSSGFLTGSSSAIPVTSTSNSGTADEGGLIGYVADGTLSTCFATGNVTNNASGPGKIGGLVGNFQGGTIISSYSTGTVSGTGANASEFGGLVGFMTNSTTIKNRSHSSSTVTTGGASSESVGGLVGYMFNGTVQQSYSTGTVTGTSYVGGLVGFTVNSTPTISESYSTSPVTGKSYVGGIVGYVTGANSINDCYATGSVTANAGTLAGGSIGGFTAGVVNRLYSTGSVSGSSSSLSGGVAQIPNTTSQGKSWLWDTQTSGQATSAGGRGRTTVLMQAISTFLNESWDFSGVWQIPTGGGYPIFQWQADPTEPTIAGLFAGGDGTPTNAYQIGTAAQLQNLAHAVQLDWGARFAYYKLTATVDLAGQPMPVIGTSSHPFGGVFNGQNYQIQNYAVTANSDYVGLFGYIDGGTVQNLTLTAGTINGSIYNYVGALVGYATGVTTLSHITVTLGGTVSGTQYVGGLAGYLNTSTGTIVVDCNVGGGGAVTGYTSGPGTSQNIGGLIGYFTAGNIDLCSSTVPVSEARNSVAGLVGDNVGMITNSFSTGAVSSTVSGANYVGGLVGTNHGSISLQSYATGNVSATTSSEYVGGLVGYQHGTVYQAYSTGTVTGVSKVGGLFGKNDGNVSQTYSTSAVTGDSYIGGIAGYQDDASGYVLSDSYATGAVTLNAGGSRAGGAVGSLQNGKFTHVFSTGAVTGGGGATLMGGFVGEVSSVTNMINGDFWDAQASGNATSAGTTNYKTSYTSGHFGLQTAPMQAASSFAAAGYDFYAVWKIPNAGGYPIFQWQEAMSPVTIGTLFASGTGTESDPYIISSATQLQNVAYAVQLGITGAYAYYKLSANQDLSGYVSPVIGTSSYPFKGTFDGNSKSILSYKVSAFGDQTGLFGYVAGGTIKNLTVVADNVWGQSYNSVGSVVGEATTVLMSGVSASLSFPISGTNNIGGLIGQISSGPSTLTQLSVVGGGSASVTGSSSIGGMVGNISADNNIIKASKTQVPVTGSSNVGGFVGYMATSTLQNVYSLSTVTGGDTTGGLVGSTQGTIQNSYSTATVTSTGSYIGGLVGYLGETSHSGSVTESYSTGSVTGGGTVGGLVGYHRNGTIARSYSSSAVTGSNNAGGLIGFTESNTTDAYATGAVVSNGDSRAGGAIGWIHGGTTTNVYSKGAVSGTSSNKGGFYGYRDGGSVIASYWDTSTAGQGNSGGSPTTLSGVTGATTGTLQTQATFTGASWDFTTANYWVMGGYPIFQWQSAATGGGIAALFNGGDGTSATPYLISNETQLANMETAVQDTGAQRAYYKLTADITIVGASPVIGTSAYPFYGSFDGNGKSISDFNLSVSNDYVGLFGNVGAGAIIKNLTLNVIDINTSNHSYVGAVVGYAANPVTLSGITVSIAGTVYGYNYVGGLVGYFGGGDIVGCSVTGAGSISVTGSYTGGLAGKVDAGGVLSSFNTLPITSTYNGIGAYLGGFIGSCASGAVVASYATGNVTNNEAIAAHIGGLIGSSNCTVSQQSHATGVVTANGANAQLVGGLVGKNTGTIRMAYKTNSTTSLTGNSVGGLVGVNNGGTIYQSYASGNVTGKTYVGGLVGNTTSDISDAYALGDVVASGGNAGGGAIGNVASGTVSYVYSIGAVTGTSTNLGGLIGVATPTVYGGNWDTGTSMATSAAGIGQSTVNMKLQKTFVNQGWNFGTTWVLSTGTSYPIFQWQQAATPAAIGGLFDAGNGTKASPYEVTDAGQLQNVALAIQQGIVAQSSYFLQTADIDMAGATRPTIGSAAYPFMGDFNGDGYHITNYVLTGNNNYAGLFGYADNATIRNVSLSLSSITATKYDYVAPLLGYGRNTDLINITVTLSGAVAGRQYIGGIAGRLVNDSNSVPTVIKNCHVTGAGSVSATVSHVGGLAGSLEGNRNTLNESYSSIAAGGTTSGDTYLGGLVGYSSSIISASYSTGAVTASNGIYVGGLVGNNSGTINQKSYATGNVSASNSGSTYVGGLVGYSNGTVYHCYSTGAVDAYQYVGGIAGYNAGTVDQSYSTSNLTGVLRMGGINGENNGTLTDSYAKGSVTATAGNYVGGAVGVYSGGTMSRFMATGAVSGGSTNMGGLVGGNTTSGPTFGGVWDLATTGISTNTGSGCSVPNYCGVPYSTAYMKQKITFTNNGWDFFRTWVMTNDGSTYPILQFQQALNPTDIGALFNGGDGSSASPYQVSNAAQLENLAHAIQIGGTQQSAHYALTANINLAGLQMPVIGTQGAPFSGHFNGNGHTISNYAFTATENNTGLFGYVNGGVIKNFTLNVSSLDAASYNNIGSVIGYATGTVMVTDVTVNLSGDLTGANYVGGFAGQLAISATSVVKNCHVVNGGSGTVAGKYYVGGFVGNFTSGIIDICDAAVPTSSTTTNDDIYLGGLVGRMSSGTINASYSSGAVSDSAASARRIGGLVGQNEGTISGKSYSSSTVTAAAATSKYAGGLVGVNSGTITTAYATGAVSSYDEMGALVGYNNGTITQSYATGNASGHSYVGALVGNMSGGTLSESYATGSATSAGGGSTVGGAIGVMPGGTVLHLYSTGAVSGTTAGGLIGSYGGGTFYNSVWDTTTSAQASSAKGSGFATALMKTAATYASLHFDFRSVWQIQSGAYPVLQWQQESAALPSLASLFNAGDGTQSSPFEIATAAQLGNMAYAMQIYAGAQTAYYILTANINLSGASKVVIGDSSYPFKGFLDGQGYTISNYSITAQSDYIGLFGYVDGATIINVNLNASTITTTGNTIAANYVGGLIGYATGVVYLYGDTVTLSGTISAASNVGGFAGKLDVAAHSLIDTCSVANDTSGAVSATRDFIGGFTGKLTAGLLFNSSSAIPVTSTYNTTTYVAGLVGYNGGTISTSYSTGATTNNTGSANYVAGLVAWNDGTINKQSYSTGAVSATSGTHSGGLVGYNNSGATITQSYSTSAVTGHDNTGGLSGSNYGSITESYATGNVSGSSYVGGLVGLSQSTISDCYATGTASGTNAGGLVGYVDSNSVANCYSTGTASGGGVPGGLVGSKGGSGAATNSFWDSQASGVGASILGTGNNTTTMQTSTTFSGAGWIVDPSVVPLATPDPNYTWKFTAASGVYPVLGWQ